MKITIKKYSKTDFNDWENFVKKSNNGTIFHLRKFIGYHAKDKFIDNSILFYKKRKIIAVLPAVCRKLNNKIELVSHLGTSIGSLVVLESLTIFDALEITSILVDYAKKNLFDRVQLTLPPIIYQKRISNYIDFALIKSGFKYNKREVSSIMHIENTLEKCLNKFKSNHRRAVKKAIKSGIKIKISNDYKTFYKILEQNLSIRHNVKPTHTLSELQKLKLLFPDNIYLFGAFLDEKMIAGVINFIINNKVVLAFYISHNDSYQEMRPINLIFYNIIDWAIHNQFSILDFGIFTINEIPNMGLARFKENFGSSGVFRETVELNL